MSEKNIKNQFTNEERTSLDTSQAAANGILRKKITIINKLGLHARASAKLVKIAGRFTADIKIHYEHKVVDGKSIMGIMMLAASKGTELEITVEGEDAAEAMHAIAELVNNRFEEAE